MLLYDTICIWFFLRAISYYMRISYSRGRALKQRKSISGPHTFLKKKWTACPRMNVPETAQDVPSFRLVFSITSLQFFFVVTGLLSRFLFHVTKQVPRCVTHIVSLSCLQKRAVVPCHHGGLWRTCEWNNYFVPCHNGKVHLHTHNHMRYVLCSIRHRDHHSTLQVWKYEYISTIDLLNNAAVSFCLATTGKANCGRQAL